MLNLIKNYKGISQTSFARVEFYTLRTEMDNPKKAELNLRYALNYKPVSLNVYLQLVQHYLNQNNPKRADQVTKEAWAVFPDNRELYPHILKTQMAAGNVDKANKLMKSCEVKKPLIYDEMCRKPYKKAKEKHKNKHKNAHAKGNNKSNSKNSKPEKNQKLPKK